jgi:exosortase
VKTGCQVSNSFELSGVEIERASTDGILEEFRIEFLKCWHQLPNKGFFFGLLVAWLALFQFLGNPTLGYIPTPSLLSWMYAAYQPTGDHGMADDGHGMMVPFLVLGLLWWKRKELMEVSVRTWWPGLLGMGLGLLLHVVGYAVQQPRISIVGLFVGIYGLMGLAWGPGWLRASFFPFFLFAFSVPFGSLGQPITVPLRLLVSWLVEMVCHFVLSIDVIRNGNMLSDPTGHYQYEVAAACSGIRSLVAIFLMATVYAFLGFTSWWKRLLLIGSAFPFAILGNLIRMLLIVVAADMGGQKSGNFVHDNSILSLSSYVPAMLGLFFLGRFLEGSKAQSGKGSANQSGATQPETVVSGALPTNFVPPLKEEQA